MVHNVKYRDHDFHGIVNARRQCKKIGLTHGVEYYVETRRAPNGALKGYRIYYDLDDEKLVWLKLHGLNI